MPCMPVCSRADSSPSRPGGSESGIAAGLRHALADGSRGAERDAQGITTAYVRSAAAGRRRRSLLPRARLRTRNWWMLPFSALQEGNPKQASGNFEASNPGHWQACRRTQAGSAAPDNDVVVLLLG